MYTLQALERLVLHVANTKGGALLDKLSRLSTLAVIESLVKFTSTCSCKALLDMLTDWVTKKIDDPYNEFLISVNESQQAHNLLDDFNTKYWEERYTIRDTMVPEELKAMANKILVTGKYLNVLHSVGTKSNRKSVDLENESGINSTLNRESPVKLIPGASEKHGRD